MLKIPKKSRITKADKTTGKTSDSQLFNGVTAAPRTFAIIHGLAEGPYLSRRLRKALEAAGLSQAKPQEADIILSHSGGTYGLPRRTRARHFIHINPPYWPGKPLPRSIFQKVAYDFRLHRQRHQLRRWMAELAANAVYAGNLPHMLRMLWSYVRARHTFNTLPAGNHLFIRTYIDSFCNSRALYDVSGGRHSYLTIAGHHDDCWREPEPYLQVIRSLYN